MSNPFSLSNQIFWMFCWELLLCHFNHVEYTTGTKHVLKLQVSKQRRRFEIGYPLTAPILAAGLCSGVLRLSLGTVNDKPR
jgi:hypothetical protein